MKLISNPVLIKELRGRMRGNRAVVLLTIYLSVISVVTLLVYLAVVSSMSFGASSFDVGRQIGRSIFITVMSVALAQVCIITPSLTSGSIAGEKERQSYDLLVTTLLSPVQIILGKLGAALAFALLLIIAVLPLAGLSFLFGGVSGLEMVLGMVGLLVSAMLYASLGLMWSTIMRSTLGSTVMAQGTVLIWLMGIPFLFLILGAIAFERDPMQDIISSTLFVYVSGAVLCSHPFIALGMTQFQLSQGENPFFLTMDPTGLGQDILVPSPWLAFTVIGLVMALVFLAISVRMLAARQGGTGRQRGARPSPPPRATPQRAEASSGE